MSVRRIIVEMSSTNPVIHMDEVALVNVSRRLKQACPSGYGEVHFKMELVGHFIRYITTTLEARMIVDAEGPSFAAEVIDVAQSEEEEV